MQKLLIKPTETTPEIHFSPDEKIFFIRGTSSPEDVRALYYPVIQWVNNFVDSVSDNDLNIFSQAEPMKFQADFLYFNSSSAKFLYDIFSELKRLPPKGIPVIVEWFYEKEDIDLKEAGVDIALLVGMEFTYIQK
jgi:hypothetical protein